MDRRTLILGLVASSVSTRRAAAWTLITPEEAARDQAAPHVAPLFSTLLPNGPTIEVEQPDPAKPIIPPVTIRLRFVPQGTATIDIGSFRVLYGWLHVNITDRILRHSQVTQTGLIATDADIAPGKYSIRIEIADNLHRVGARDFEFTVG